MVRADRLQQLAGCQHSMLQRRYLLAFVKDESPLHILAAYPAVTAYLVHNGIVFSLLRFIRSVRLLILSLSIWTPPRPARSRLPTDAERLVALRRTPLTLRTLLRR